MENNQKILGFANIDIPEYLNKVHATDEKFLVETQKHNLTKYRDELYIHLRLSFIENCDSLLDTYKQCQELLQGCRLPRPTHSEPDASPHRSACADLSRAFRHFSDDMAPFLTPERYLVRSDVFGPLLCILSNDLLFIGEKESGSRKYSLKHSFSKSVIDIVPSGPDLLVRATSGSEYTLAGDSDALKQFIEAFRELSYAGQENGQHDEQGSGHTGHRRQDDGLVEYYVETEQWQLLKQLLGGSRVTASQSLNICSIEDLKTAMAVFDDPIGLYGRFIVARFREGLGSINRIQRARPLIVETFDYLDGFVRSTEGVSAELEGVDRGHVLLCIERLVKEALGSLEKRVFNKFYEIRLNTDCIELIKSRLVFDGLDFSYLIELLMDKQHGFEERCLQQAKQNIQKKLDGLFLDNQ